MAKRRRKKKRTQLGALEPRHTFFLNPYSDQRFTRCPGCGEPTLARKTPFLVHVDPQNLLMLNMTGRYCRGCDLLILHKDRLESLMVRAVERNDPTMIGRDYLVLGTVERSYWRQHHGGATMGGVLAQSHDFQKVVIFKPAYATWGPEGGEGGED